MFEKEAEEYQIGKHHQRLYGDNPVVMKELNTTYKDGFKDGYNKANEWHFVKDGDLPKAYQKCCFIYSNSYKDNGKVDFSESSINVLTGIYAFYLDEETWEETADPCFYDDINDEEIIISEVYAWKEIVLPEVKE